MRADRLLSILMILQARGKTAAQQLAEELEVSVRTIYRDIDSLSAAGVPIYAERGPGGGCVLIEGYRTNLTGLTQDEVKALFMLSVPASLDRLGVSQDLRSALRKLGAALPTIYRSDEEKVRRRIYLDWSTRSQDEESTPCLQPINWTPLIAPYDNKHSVATPRVVSAHGIHRLTRLWGRKSSPLRVLACER